MDRQVEALAELLHNSRYGLHSVHDGTGSQPFEVPVRPCGVCQRRAKEWDYALRSEGLSLARLNDEAERGERCEDCGHPPEHHLDEHGCYCGCRKRRAAVQSKGGPE